jgi:hypothetical protein
MPTTYPFLNNITRCPIEVGRVLNPNSKFYATFFNVRRLPTLTQSFTQWGDYFRL